jgi:urease accessory protein
MRTALRAAARVAVDAGPARQRVRWTHAWPVVLRPTGPDGGGGDRVHLVHAAGGPLGGDELSLTVDVGASARLAVRSAGATLVQPGAGPAVGLPAQWAVSAQVGVGGRLCWSPEPTVVSDGAVMESTLRVELAAGATAQIREVVVLGRHGQRGGRCTSRLNVVVDGVPLLVHTTMLDGADPALCGPAGTAGARAVGTLVCAGHDATSHGRAGEATGVRWAWSALDGPGTVLLGVGTPAAVTAVLDAVADPRASRPRRRCRSSGPDRAGVGPTGSRRTRGRTPG